MRRWLAAIVLPAVIGGPPLAAATSVPAPPSFQQRFDDVGPAVQALAGPQGRTIHFADTGEAGWRPVLFIGGTGTSARSFLMTGYLETLRRQLHLRFVTVERNGFGDTPHDPAWGYPDYVGEVRAVLDHLAIGRFAIVAISGGGPYAAYIAAAMPERLLSVHMAAALARVSGELGPVCALPPDKAAASLAPSVRNPEGWWAMPANSPTRRIPGFAERSYDEGARTFFIRGQMGDPAPEAAEMRRYCSGELPDLSGVRAPLFTYYGGADTLVAPSNGAYWRSHFGGPAIGRDYPGEWHDVQYRHWDQIMLDMAGFGDRLLVCVGGKARLKPPAVAAGSLERGATLGVCAWR